MSAQQLSILSGVILDSNITFTLSEFCSASGAQSSLIIEMVDEGIIEPEIDAENWYFRGDALVRAHRALRLMRDLDVNLAGAALAVDLIEQLEILQGRTDRA
ncbi:MAG TPA: chaperone modulator CbpM [Woeseiaceae bacterium]|nr:chaperone modulator CbpM [Woeseiaceae bacterium]